MSLETGKLGVYEVIALIYSFGFLGYGGQISPSFAR